MGALRVGKLAKFLATQGHDVRVLSARNVPRPQSLPQEFPEDRIVRASWLDVNAPKAAFARWLRSHAGSGQESQAPTRGNRTGGQAAALGEIRKGRGRSLWSRMSELYVNLINFPDAFVGWIPQALSVGKRMIRSERPEIILASGPPFTTLIIGALLSRWSGIPWVAEFRDRWADDPYYPPPAYRAWMERTCERRLVRGAAGLVTVSEPWADAYRRTYGKPVCTVYNGYDPDEFTETGDGSPESQELVIVHTGRIYPGRRDPTPLFQAVRLLGEKAQVRIQFYGTQEERVMPLAREMAVEHFIEVRDHVPYAESLAIQRKADILLFMQWNDPREQGNVPGKLFEYLAARRPILGLGLIDGVPAGIIRERGAGFFCNDPHAIGHQLAAWSEEKRAVGYLKALPASVPAGFSRNEQFAVLVSYLKDLLEYESAIDEVSEAAHG